MTLQPIPAPGVAIHPAYIAQRPETLVMKSGFSGNHFVVTDSNGTAIIKLDAERFSMSHRINVSEAATGKQLCTLRRELFKMRAHYYAEVGEGGPRLFDLESQWAMGSEKFVIKLPNAAAGGEEVELDWKSPAFRSRGEIYLNGMMVALLERERFKLKDEFHIHVAPGMDKLLAVCVMACVDDRRDTNNAGAAAGGGGGGGGASGC